MFISELLTVIYKKIARALTGGGFTKPLSPAAKRLGRSPILEADYAVIDTEFSGGFKKPVLLSIGIVPISRGRALVGDAQEIIVKQPHTANDKSAEIHGLLHHNHGSTLDEAAAIDRFAQAVAGRIIVGHSIRHDTQLLDSLYKKYLGHNMDCIVVDTHHLARRLENPSFDLGRTSAGEYQLDALCRRLNIPVNDRHTAGGDAFMTALVFLKLMPQASKRGLKTVDDLALS